MLGKPVYYLLSRNGVPTTLSICLSRDLKLCYYKFLNIHLLVSMGFIIEQKLIFIAVYCHRHKPYKHGRVSRTTANLQ